MKKRFIDFYNKTERGQAIILIVFAFVGLIAMVGLVTDTGILLIEYGKLKRSVDASAVAGAQQYRVESQTNTINQQGIEDAAINFLYLNQISNLQEVLVRTCEDTTADRPALCNPVGGDPVNNRKLVQVTASANVFFGFLRVLGFNSVTLTATSIGEAATIDLVLIMDTSASMAFETGTETDCSATANPNTCLRSDADDDPSVCNDNNTCEPMRAVKNVAIDFIDTLYFPYDRVAIIAMTSQTPGGDRYRVEVLPLTSDRTTVTNAINGVKVFEPRVCDGSDTEGSCLNYGGGVFTGAICQIYENHSNEASANPSSCPSSNVGGVLNLARYALLGSGDEDNQRLDAFWVVVALIGGPANATDIDDPTDFPNGFCPQNTWLLSQGQGPWCRDPYPSTRHDDSDTTSYTNPISGSSGTISVYDADDYARDMADALATLTTGDGVTVYTIGLGAQIQAAARDGYGTILAGEPPPGEDLLIYIAEEAGGADVNHGQYFYAPTSSSLSDIFDRIAKNIATKISQ